MVPIPEFRFTPRARTGLPLAEMNAAQRVKAHALVKTGLSMRGYTAASAIIDLENVLRAIEPPRTGPNAIVRDPELYYVSIYGDPNGKTPWGWKFEGHHISVNFTIVDGKPIVFAPSFFGSNPAVVKDGPQAGKRALREEEESGRALMALLTEEQKAKAIFSPDAPREMLTAETGMDQVTFGWAGTLTVGGPHYYRVQGPSFLIEYDNVQDNANHIHSVWRDFNGDFGRDLLREHDKTFAH